MFFSIRPVYPPLRVSRALFFINQMLRIYRAHAPDVVRSPITVWIFFHAIF